MKSALKIELARELASDLTTPAIEVGVRAGVDQFHPLYRSQVVTSFASWDLLDIYQHKDVKSAAIHSIETLGSGGGTGRYIGGITPAHTACEGRFKQFFGSESALLFNAKNQAFLTLVTALATGGGVVVGPALSLLPLADACALVELDYAEFDNINDLGHTLERFKSSKRIIVVAEAVSASTGIRLDLPAFFAVLEQYAAWGIIDESAAVGHSGLRGAGSAEAFPASPSLLARVCSATTLGGVALTVVTSSSELKELLIQRSRYLRSEQAPSVADCAIARSALDLVELAITQRDRLLARAQSVRAAIIAQGWQVSGDTDLPIVSLSFETLEHARSIQEALIQRNILVEVITTRGIRRTGAVARILLSTGHTESEIARLLDGLLEVRKRGQQQRI